MFECLDVIKWMDICRDLHYCSHVISFHVSSYEPTTVHMSAEIMAERYFVMATETFQVILLM